MPKVLGPIAYFWGKVDKSGDCWLWTGTINLEGYGSIKRNRVRYVSHRVSYEALVGPIPEGYVIDHLCRVRNCVNPEHLEPVTIKENVLRGQGMGARHARREHCPVCGGANWAIRSDGGRRCKTCINAKARVRREIIKGAPLRKWGNNLAEA